MEWLLYDDEDQEFWLVDERLLRGLRSTFEAPSDDPDYLDEFDLLEQYGWRKATPLTVAMVAGEVRDKESLLKWHRERSSSGPEAMPSNLNPDYQGQVAEIVAHFKMHQANQPKDAYTIEEIAAKVHRSVWQVRKWCREGRLLAKKTASNDQWLISHAELVRYQNEKLRPSRDG